MGSMAIVVITESREIVVGASNYLIIEDISSECVLSTQALRIPNNKQTSIIYRLIRFFHLIMLIFTQTNYNIPSHFKESLNHE
jgi:hypothetical protein